MTLKESIEKNIKDKICIRDWKVKDERYAKELQKFLDIADNISDEKLKIDIIYQMLKCDEILTKIIEEKFEN